MAERRYSNVWPRHPHDVDGAWEAVDDLRQALGSPQTIAEWRQRVVVLERVVDELQDNEQVAKAVADALRKDRALGLTILQKTAAGFIALVFAAGAIASLIEVLK